MYFYAIFLRGVNVGGVKILMKDLAVLLEQAGFSRVRTLLASGNVVLASDEPDPEAVKRTCEAAIDSAYGYGTRVIVQDVEQLEFLAGNFPFVPPNDGIQRHDYLVLTESAEEAASILGTAPQPSGDERVEQLAHGICWEVPRGQSLDSQLAKHFTKMSSKFLVTTRNMNTINKMLTALKALA
ncbi:DUF1697 domain-containing protein [Paeniglutamicibacter sp. NPDC091659]|uniref:DUF1697 domain-containing protein n=1 Tax=Paeniglutamicibacter sp. NPDC091659 TaxID=3364389 RepID=UPI00380DED52